MASLLPPMALACSAKTGGPGTPSQNGNGGSGGAPAAGGTTAAGGQAVATAGANNLFGSLGGANSGGAGGGCATSSFKSDLLPTNILFVVDRSGSMKCLPDTPAADCDANVPATAAPGSKWSEITTALTSTFDALKDAPATAAGLSFFSNDDVCGANSQPSVEVNAMTQPQVDALNASLSAIQPNGGTPIIGATVLAYKHLHQEALALGNRFVVLVTDGADSCLDGGYDVTFDPVQQLLDVELPKAISVNIRTFVIGAPGSENARGLLSRIASLGGTARTEGCDDSMSAADVGDCHFDMTTSTDFAADFAAALDQITGRAAQTCEFAVPTGSHVDTSLVNVSYFKGGTEEVQLYRDDSAPCDGGADGWQYSNDDQTKLVLCGDICNQVRDDLQGRVDIVLGCQTRLR
jgi:hypothetical protein